MALYSALVHEDNFKEALVLSVNHDGDSDSTGSICGNIMGVIHGYSNLPIDWIDKVELVDLMEDLSEKLFTFKY